MYRFENSKCRKLSLELIFIDNYCQNIKTFCKQNSMLRIYSKPTEFPKNWTGIDKNFQCALRLNAPSFIGKLLNGKW